MNPKKERVCLKPVHSREPYKVWLVRWSGDWKGKVNLTLATMDDLQVVLGDILPKASQGFETTDEFAMHWGREDPCI